MFVILLILLIIWIVKNKKLSPKADLIITSFSKTLGSSRIWKSSNLVALRPLSKV